MAVRRAISVVLACMVGCDGEPPARTGNPPPPTERAATAPESPPVEPSPRRPRGTPQVLPTIKLTIGGTVLRVGVARTDAERAKGLMYRTELAEDEGMLFIFPTPKLQSFWMRDTPLPLGLAYVDGGGRIVQLESLTPFDETGIESREPVPFVLEVRQGWFERHGVGIGAYVDGIEAALSDPSLAPR